LNFLQKIQLILFPILLPFNGLYALITDFRNFLYDKKLFKSTHFDKIYTICVGNLTVGGTGKTPHIEYLIRFLTQNFKIATLSRGYGRQTKGFRLASAAENASTLGDEPFQFYEKFGTYIPVAVCEKRVKGIEMLTSQITDIQIVLLDDALQHRALQADFYVLLTDYQRLFYNDFPFPAGLLRESRSQAKKATCVVVSKCPETLKKAEMAVIKSKIANYTKKNTPIYFSKIIYGIAQNIFTQTSINQKNTIKKCVVLSGIAQPIVFEKYCQTNFEVQQIFTFPDHFIYTQKNLQEVFQVIENQEFICITTEKDKVKLKPLIPENLQKYFFYLPIEVAFLDDSAYDSTDNSEKNLQSFTQFLIQNHKNRVQQADLKQ
jgi:tetraacyldisaccharide 4'-kinase